jgi:hypothetical protein
MTIRCPWGVHVHDVPMIAYKVRGVVPVRCLRGAGEVRGWCRAGAWVVR